MLVHVYSDWLPSPPRWQRGLLTSARKRLCPAVSWTFEQRCTKLGTHGQRPGLGWSPCRKKWIGRSIRCTEYLSRFVMIEYSPNAALLHKIDPLNGCALSPMSPRSSTTFTVAEASKTSPLPMTYGRHCRSGSLPSSNRL